MQYPLPRLLVCRRAAVQEKMAPHTADRRCTPRPQVIVVVDDADSLRQLWRDWLALFGFDVVEARTGAEAVTLATYHRPAAVIMDLAMPVMDGPSFIRAIRSIRPEVLIMGLSGLIEHAGLSTAGAADVKILEKPCTAEDLILNVQRLLNESRADNPGSR